MLLPGLSKPEYLRRFQAEASTAARLQHPNVVAIQQVGAWEGRQYLVMDFVAGSSLPSASRRADAPGTFVRSQAGWPAWRTRFSTRTTTGFSTGDLKPSNVLIYERDQPRVTDFGLAKHMGDQSELTLSGQALGSPGFMPPEQAGSRDKVSRRSDVYGLGATLYYALIGHAPSTGDTPVEVTRHVLAVDAAAPRRLDPAIPRDLETISLKCSRRTRGGDMPARRRAEDLRHFLDGRPIGALVFLAKFGFLVAPPDEPALCPLQRRQRPSVPAGLGSRPTGSAASCLRPRDRGPPS